MVTSRKLVGAFDFEPERSAGVQLVGGVEEGGWGGVESERAAFGAETDVAARPGVSFFADGAGVVDFTRNFVVLVSPSARVWWSLSSSRASRP